MKKIKEVWTSCSASIGLFRHDELNLWSAKITDMLEGVYSACNKEKVYQGEVASFSSHGSHHQPIWRFNVASRVITRAICCIGGGGALEALLTLSVVADGLS